MKQSNVVMQLLRMTIACCALVLLGTGSLSAQEATAPDAEPTALQNLLDVLKDDDARAALISELEAAVTPEVVEEVKPDDVILSLGRRIATLTQEFAETSIETLGNFWGALSGGASVFSGLRGDELSILLEALPGLLVVIVITMTIYLVLRSFARRVYRRVDGKAENARGLALLGMFVGSNLLGAVIVVIAWAAGYLVTLLLIGEFGQIGIRQSMYLNAFLIVGLGRWLVRTALSPISGSLRLIPVSNYAARVLSRICGAVISILGYGHLLVVPIVNQSASFAAGNGTSAVLSTLVLLYLFWAVMRHRKGVADWLKKSTEAHEQLDLEDDLEEEERQARIAQMKSEEPGAIRHSLHALAAGWHWFALAYLALMFVVVMTQPAQTTFNALIGSGKILLAIMFATLMSGWLANSVARGVSLPQDVNEKLPLLELRINRFVPQAFGLLRLSLLVFVFVFSLDVIGIIDMRAWLESQVGLAVTTTVISVSVLLLVAFALWLALTSFVDYRLNPEFGAVPTARETTLLTLMRNALTIVLIVLTAMFCLSEIGLDIGPLLASAGVLGLAIGFGAQKMVQDIITGIFIQFENAINVGDVITLSGITGGVERLSVRSVSLRDVQGVLHIIPFSSVDMVSNFMKDFSYFVCDMGIAYREDVDEAKDAMFEAFDKLMEDGEIARDIIAPLEWHGLNSFGDSAVVVRARIKTVPGKQWGTGRAYNAVLKKVFDARGIEIPFPQQTIWFGEAKDGSTQPVRIAESDNT